MAQRFALTEALSAAFSNCEALKAGYFLARTKESALVLAGSGPFMTVSAMRQRKIPTYPLADYSDGMTQTSDFFIGTFEGSVKQRPNRLTIHRHDYFELFLLDGKGEHFNDFEFYSIEAPSIVCVSPGQVHSWRGALEGPMICFTQDWLTVSEIAYGLKFEDPSYFNRFFRRLTGKTPTDFRNHLALKLCAP